MNDQFYIFSLPDSYERKTYSFCNTQPVKGTNESIIVRRKSVMIPKGNTSKLSIHLPRICVFFRLIRGFSFSQTLLAYDKACAPKIVTRMESWKHKMGKIRYRPFMIFEAQPLQEDFAVSQHHNQTLQHNWGQITESKAKNLKQSLTIWWGQSCLWKCKILFRFECLGQQVRPLNQNLKPSIKFFHPSIDTFCIHWVNSRPK